MRIRFFLLFLMIMVANASGDPGNKPHKAKNIVAKYEVTIIMNKNLKWVGVILSPRFVLSSVKHKTDSYSLYNPKNYILYIGYIPLEGQKTFIEPHIHHTERIWILNKQIMLLKTDREITFNENVQYINLPRKADLKAWHHPCNIPNHQKFTTSYWCKVKTCSSERTHYSITNVRNCLPGECHLEQDLIPSCMIIKSDKADCELKEGAPLVYNNTLVGIRINEPTMKPNDIYENDLFINVSPYVERIDMLMSGELQCNGKW